MIILLLVDVMKIKLKVIVPNNIFTDVDDDAKLKKEI